MIETLHLDSIIEVSLMGKLGTVEESFQEVA